MASFNSAFASARKSGKKEFTWNGKRYNTKLKGEGFESTPKKAPVPTSKPSAKKPKSIFSGVDSDSLVSKKPNKPAMPKTGRDRFGPAGLDAAPKLSTAKKVGRAIRIGETAVNRLGRLDKAAEKNVGMKSSVDKMLKGMK